KKSLYLENGRDVDLYIQGQKVMTAKTTVDPQSGDATTEFSGVTMTHSLSGYEVKVEATNLAGLTGSKTKNVTVDTGKCGVDLFPKNTECLLSDENPGVEGFQRKFTVVNPDKTCDKAKLTVDIAGNQTETALVDLDESGQGEIEVKLSDDLDGINGAQVKIMATVIDSANSDRNASSPFYDYTIDTEDPGVSITSPTKTSFNLLDDKDQQPANGINLDFSGTVAGLPAAGEVELLINEQYYGAATTDPDGHFTFEDVAFTSDGLQALKFRVFDGCKREGFAALDLVMNVSQAALMFVFPVDQQVLYAKDDKDADTPALYEADFKVYGENVASGNKLAVRCKNNFNGSVFYEVGSLTVAEIPQDFVFTVPVSLSVANQNYAFKTCYAEYIAPNPAQSAEIDITVALPAPLLKVLTPKENALTNSVNLSVSLYPQNLDGVSPSSKITDLNDNLILEYQTAKKIANNGILFSVPLIVAGSPIPDGSYKVVVDAEDIFGNKAGDITANDVVSVFKFDASPPEIGFLKPSKDKLEPDVYPEDADEDLQAAGYQQTVRVSVSESDLAGVLVCLDVNSQGEKCVTMTGAEQYAEWTGVTLAAGNNVLKAYAVDNAKNKTADLIKTIYADLDALRVEIVSPAKDGPVGALPFTLKVLVSDKDTLLPIENAFVKLFRNDNEI
ncbi:MAG: hypothetical protein FJ088_08770, partial [Deltaproteobacteria bacterium]|nr:hypothetical protein [Deltaproteobacteria bacterium]